MPPVSTTSGSPPHPDRRLPPHLRAGRGEHDRRGGLEHVEHSGQIRAVHAGHVQFDECEVDVDAVQQPCAAVASRAVATGPISGLARNRRTRSPAVSGVPPTTRQRRSVAGGCTAARAAAGPPLKVDARVRSGATTAGNTWAEWSAGIGRHNDHVAGLLDMTRVG